MHHTAIHTCTLTNQARRGAYAKPPGRAAAALLLRGRVGGELCRHSLSGSQCTQNSCPFVHRAPRGADNGAAPALAEDAAVAFSAAPPAAAPLAAASAPAAAPAPPRAFGDITQYRRVGERPMAGRLMVLRVTSNLLARALTLTPTSSHLPSTPTLTSTLTSLLEPSR